MSEDWSLFTEDGNEENYRLIDNLLPSSLKAEWTEPSSFQQTYNLHQQPNFNYASPQSMPKRTRPFPFHESPPGLSFKDDIEGALPTAEPQLPVRTSSSATAPVRYFMVQFHPYRAEPFKWVNDKDLSVGDYVVTEADRGYDVGKIIAQDVVPSVFESKQVKYIVRRASHHEISQLPLKEEKEKRAKEYCQAKARELELPMEITGAELQFDGKKLSFYYTAKSYIDFRDLVRVLFRTFGMRIWMVWHDGNAPVRDVHQRSEYSLK